MRILYIDTSSSYLYAGIVEDEKLVCEVKKEFGHSLSEEALPEIAALFTNNNIKPEDINKIIVVDGPGSFTGIRIGITIAKVYAWSLNIPITTISALEAMSISSDISTVRVPMLNARRGYVFAAAYTNNNEVVIEPRHIKMSELFEILSDKEYTIISNDEFELEDRIEEYDPNILKIVSYFREKKSINPHSVNPEYLKLTEAEESKLSW